MKMKISLKEWLVVLLLALAAFFSWWKIEYPSWIVMDWSVKKQEAVAAAEEYLSSRGVSAAGYSVVVVLKPDDWVDRYLQRALGLTAEEDFFRRHDFEVFSWQVRFFRPQQKEEYRVWVSPRNGAILKFDHYIKDTEPRLFIEKETARVIAWDFLRLKCGLDPGEYDFHQEETKRYDKRIDYRFSWEKKGVYIPWKGHAGGAKLLAEATVSGQEVRVFSKNKFDIPEGFRRFVENQFSLGEFLNIIGFLLVVTLVVWAIFILLTHRGSLVIHTVSRWYYGILGIYFVISIADMFNNLPRLIVFYPTSASMANYLGSHLLQLFSRVLFMSTSFLIPALAGEFLVSQDPVRSGSHSLAHYVRSHFLTRGLTASILMGYLLFVIMVGLQALIFFFGQKYCGVWKEWLRLTEFSSAYLPVVGACAVGFTASVSEELFYRLFGIAVIKKFTRRQWLAILLVSFVWGLGHSTYPIFPMWFRVLEITIIGIFLGYAYVRFGLIALLVAHYLFDVFLSTAAYLFGASQPYVFLSSVFSLCLPLIAAAVAWMFNRPEDESDMRRALNPVQQYNLEMLEVFVAKKRSEGATLDSIKEELIRHNWDPALVGLAIERIRGNLR